MRVRGISGRYEGGRAGSAVIGDLLDLRVDVDQRYNANSRVMDRVSADVYARRFTRDASGRLVPVSTYLESWIVDAPEVSWSRCSVEINGAVRFWRGIHPATTVRIVVPWSDGAVGPAEVVLAPAGAPAATYICSFRSDCFRDVVLETDYCRSVNQAPQLPAYDATWHAVRPGDTPRRGLTIEETYREAGICVTLHPHHSDIDDSAAEFTTWSPAELHDAMEVAFTQISRTWPSWNVWGLLAGEFEDPDVGGVMFDTAARFDGAGEVPERQGFAVFRNHRWFDHLTAGDSMSQDQAWAMRQFLYTWVHEAGHAFNLLHSWNKARPDSLSWMNYPSRYDDRNGPDSFWSDFRFRFDEEELVHIRHGDRASVILGGDPWASGGHLEAPPGAMAQTGPGGEAELLLRSKGYFEFMEPVEIEVRVRNTSSHPLLLDARLEPASGNTAVYVRHPDGRVTMYDPVLCLTGMPRTVTLEPLAPDGANEGRDRYSARLSLSYGMRGFVFDEPGQYLLRVVYAGGDLLLTSNTLRVRMGRPTDRDQDRFAHDFLTPAVGLALVLDGSQSPALSGGMDRLHEAAGRFADSELGAKAAYTVAHSIGNDFYRRRDDRLVRSHRADPATALALTDAAVAYYRRGGSKEQNLAYHRLVRLRAGLHAQVDAVRRARDELQALADDLSAREVNRPVLEDIRTFTASLTSSRATT